MIRSEDCTGLGKYSLLSMNLKTVFSKRALVRPWSPAPSRSLKYKKGKQSKGGWFLPIFIFCNSGQRSYCCKRKEAIRVLTENTPIVLVHISNQWLNEKA